MLYQTQNTFLSRCGSGHKILAVMLFSISMGLVSSYTGIVIGILAILLIILGGKLGRKEIFSNLKLLWTVVLSIVLINTFVLGRDILTTSSMILKLLGIILSLTTLIYSTPIKELGEGIEFGLQPLGRFKFPYREVTTMITLTLRFLPEIKEDMNNILNSQICRGIDIKDSFTGKIKALLPLSINIFIISLRKSLNIAMAMDARGYNKRILKIEKRAPVREDKALIGTTLIIGLLIILF